MLLSKLSKENLQKIVDNVGLMPATVGVALGALISKRYVNDLTIDECNNIALAMGAIFTDLEEFRGYFK